MSLQSYEKECLHGIKTKVSIESLLFMISNKVNYLVPTFFLSCHEHNDINYVRSSKATGSQPG